MSLTAPSAARTAAWQAAPGAKGLFCRECGPRALWASPADCMHQHVSVEPVGLTLLWPQRYTCELHAICPMMGSFPHQSMISWSMLTESSSSMGSTKLSAASGHEAAEPTTAEKRLLTPTAPTYTVEAPTYTRTINSKGRQCSCQAEDPPLSQSTATQPQLARRSAKEV